VAMWIEFKVPGFGLPGIVSIICFATVFLSKYLVGLAQAPEILLFVIGVALLLLEIFVIPGFGIAGAGWDLTINDEVPTEANGNGIYDFTYYMKSNTALTFGYNSTVSAFCA